MLTVLNGFDTFLLEIINGLARLSTTFDWLIRLVADNSIIKNIPSAMMFFFLWFSAAPDLAEKRRKLIALIPVAFLAVAAGKGLAVVLPFRDRLACPNRVVRVHS